jgi:hypothetical protein
MKSLIQGLLQGIRYTNNDILTKTGADLCSDRAYLHRVTFVLFLLEAQMSVFVRTGMAGDQIKIFNAWLKSLVGGHLLKIVPPESWTHDGLKVSELRFINFDHSTWLAVAATLRLTCNSVIWSYKKVTGSDISEPEISIGEICSALEAELMDRKVNGERVGQIADISAAVRDLFIEALRSPVAIAV